MGECQDVYDLTAPQLLVSLPKRVSYLHAVNAHSTTPPSNPDRLESTTDVKINQGKPESHSSSSTSKVFRIGTKGRGEFSGSEGRNKELSGRNSMRIGCRGTANHCRNVRLAL